MVVDSDVVDAVQRAKDRRELNRRGKGDVGGAPDGTSEDDPTLVATCYDCAHRLRGRVIGHAVLRMAGADQDLGFGVWDRG